MQWVEVQNIILMRKPAFSKINYANLKRLQNYISSLRVTAVSGPDDFHQALLGAWLLRETLDDEMLRKELDAMRVSGQPFAYSNGWYIWKKGTQSWIKVGESTALEHDFGIRLDTTELENGAKRGSPHLARLGSR